MEFFQYRQIQVVQSQWTERLNKLGGEGWHVIHQCISDQDRGIPVWMVFLCKKIVIDAN